MRGSIRIDRRKTRIWQSDPLNSMEPDELNISIVFLIGEQAQTNRQPSQASRRKRRYSAACNPRDTRAGFGAPTRKRRSDSESVPPNAISTGPNQISNTSGL